MFCFSWKSCGNEVRNQVHRNISRWVEYMHGNISRQVEYIHRNISRQVEYTHRNISIDRWSTYIETSLDRRSTYIGTSLDRWNTYIEKSLNYINRVHRSSLVCNKYIYIITAAGFSQPFDVKIYFRRIRIKISTFNYIQF